MLEEFNLVSYRDIGMNTYTYFWRDFRGNVISPYFDSEKDAREWLDNNKALL